MPNGNENTPPESEKNNHPDIEILGQKLYFPNSFIKLFGFTVFLAAILTLCIITVTHNYGIVNNKDGFAYTLIGNKDNKADIVKGYIIGFWTPSDNTRVELRKLLDSGALLKSDSTRYSWQMQSAQGANFEEANRRFGKLLKSGFGFTGYWRYQVYGVGGSRKFKVGWWWNVSFKGKSDEGFLKEFRDAYYNLWVPNNPEKWYEFYMEIIGTKDE
jgi:hypothetical protein